MAETFGQRLLRVRQSKRKAFDRGISQDDAARLFSVSVSCYRKWEKGVCFPDARSRERMEAVWPEVFTKETQGPQM